MGQQRAVVDVAGRVEPAVGDVGHLEGVVHGEPAAGGQADRVQAEVVGVRACGRSRTGSRRRSVHRRRPARPAPCGPRGPPTVTDTPKRTSTPASRSPSATSSPANGSIRGSSSPPRTSTRHLGAERLPGGRHLDGHHAAADHDQASRAPPWRWWPPGWSTGRRRPAPAGRAGPRWCRCTRRPRAGRSAVPSRRPAWPPRPAGGRPAARGRGPGRRRRTPATATWPSSFQCEVNSSRRASTAAESSGPATAAARPGTRRASARATTGRSSALLGMHAQYEHSPPTSSLSTITVLSPAARVRSATFSPTGPAPMTTTSYVRGASFIPAPVLVAVAVARSCGLPVRSARSAAAGPGRSRCLPRSDRRHADAATGAPGVIVLTGREGEGTLPDASYGSGKGRRPAAARAAVQPGGI